MVWDAIPNYIFKEIITMVNRFVLNETSYHGAGAIKEIATEVKGRGFKKGICLL